MRLSGQLMSGEGVRFDDYILELRASVILQSCLYRLFCCFNPRVSLGIRGT
jgi:hypothetical protein